MDPALVAVVLIALAFAWTNGFHDASTAVATSLSSGTLTTRVALPLAGLLNGLGALVGVGVAQTVGTRLVTVPVARPGLGVVAAALLAAIAWNLATWALGLPSSSSHALLAGLTGAALAAGAVVRWDVLLQLVVVPLVLSPLLGFVAARLLLRAAVRGVDGATHGAARQRFRLAQTVSASAVALGHGLQDGQKTMGVVLIALLAAGRPADGVPWWVRGSVAVALAAGTVAGGGRIIRTLGRRVVPVSPATGFAAEAAAAVVLYAGAALAAPVSSTHTVTAAVVGAGSLGGVREVRWGVVRRILTAWLLTPVAAAGAAAALVVAGRALAG